MMLQLYSALKTNLYVPTQTNSACGTKLQELWDLLPHNSHLGVSAIQKQTQTPSCFYKKTQIAFHFSITVVIEKSCCLCCSSFFSYSNCSQCTTEKKKREKTKPCVCACERKGKSLRYSNAALLAYFR